MTPILTNLGRVLNALGKLRCWLFGHDRRVTHECHRTHLAHLHPLAGCRAVCERCGDVWEDRCLGAVQRGVCP